MAFYQSSDFPEEDGYYTQIPYDSRYHYSSYYPPSQSFAGFSSYEYFPTRSMVAYSACHENYINPASTEYVVYHSVSQPDDLDFEEYDPDPFHGGYDIAQTYGKPLPPSDEICYPRSSNNLNPPSPDNLPHAEEAEDLKTETEATEDEEEDQPGDGDGDDGLDEGSADSVQVYEAAGEYNAPVVDQMPPGYGLEAFDLCENLFGYWPCLSRMNKKCPSCGNEIGGRGGGGADQWKKTADYLFGSPDPYSGWADQGSYGSGNPVHVYQVQYQQPATTLYEQDDQYGQNSWLL